MKIRLLVCDKCINLLHCSSKQVELYTVLPWVELIGCFFELTDKKKVKRKGFCDSVEAQRDFFSGLDSEL